MSSQPITAPYDLATLTPQQLQVEATISRNKIMALDEQVAEQNDRLTEIESLLIEYHAERRAEG